MHLKSFMVLCMALGLAAAVSGRGGSAPAPITPDQIMDDLANRHLRRPTTAPSDWVENIKSQLLSSVNNDVPRSAARTILADREALIRELLVLVKSPHDPPLFEDSGPDWLALISLGNIRALEARQLCIDNIAVKARLQGGARRSTLISFYPYAIVLAQIGGGSDTLEMISKRISQAPPRDDRLLLTWVLYKMLGKELTAHWLDSCAKKATGKEAETFLLAAKELSDENAFITWPLGPPQ